MKRLNVAAVITAIAISAPSHANLLTFDDLSCGGQCSVPIDQSYGDVPGQVDVRYDRILGDAIPEEPMRFWNTGYSDLLNVAYGGVNDTSGATEIFLQPAPGMQVTLLAFDLGGWPNTDRVSTYTILSGSGALLASSGGSFLVSGGARSSFVVGLSSPDGVRIRLGPNAFNVGIDNVSFTVSPVPEPGTWVFLLAGLGVLGLVARRRLRAAR